MGDTAGCWARENGMILIPVSIAMDLDGRKYMGLSGFGVRSGVSQCPIPSGAWESAQTWISRGRRFRSSMVAFTSEFLNPLIQDVLDYA